MTNPWYPGAPGEEARRCPSCESLDHRECDPDILAEDPAESPELPDFHFEDQGSVWLVRPLTEGGMEHLLENVEADAQWFAGALAVEHRYARDLARALEGNGYIVGGDA